MAQSRATATDSFHSFLHRSFVWKLLNKPLLISTSTTFRPKKKTNRRGQPKESKERKNKRKKNRPPARGRAQKLQFAINSPVVRRNWRAAWWRARKAYCPAGRGRRISIGFLGLGLVSRSTPSSVATGWSDSCPGRSCPASDAPSPCRAWLYGSSGGLRACRESTPCLHLSRPPSKQNKTKQNKHPLWHHRCGLRSGRGRTLVVEADCEKTARIGAVRRQRGSEQ